MRLAGGLENPATLRKRSAMTVSASAAACTRSTYLLVSRIDSGRGPSTSGTVRSPPTATRTRGDLVPVHPDAAVGLAACVGGRTRLYGAAGVAAFPYKQS
jgi:hypothetical protein